MENTSSFIIHQSSIINRQSSFQRLIPTNVPTTNPLSTEKDRANYKGEYCEKVMKYLASLLMLSLAPAFSFQVATTRTGPIRRFHNGIITRNHHLHYSSLRNGFELSASHTSAQNKSPIGPANVETVGKVVFLLPAMDVASKFGSRSPVGNPSIMEACEQLQRKVNWFSDGKLEADVILLPENEQDFGSVRESVVNADALVAFNLCKENDLNFLRDVFATRKGSGRKNICQYALDCVGDIPPLCSSYDPQSPPLGTVIPWSNDASAKRMIELMTGLFDRWTSDDFTVSLMLFFNQFSGSEIDWVKYSIDATWVRLCLV